MSISEQIKEALDNSVDNGYEHEYDRDARDLVLEIHDFSGIDGFDPENESDVRLGAWAVRKWRLKSLVATVAS